MNGEARTAPDDPGELTGVHAAAASALYASADIYRCVFDHIGIGISLISPRMEVIAINDQMRKWFPRIHVSGMPICYRTFRDPPGDSICRGCPTCRTLRDGLIHENLIERHTSEGSRKLRILASPIEDRMGKIIAAAAMVEDVTEQCQAMIGLEMSENMYRTLFENTGTAAILIGEDMTITLVNSQFEKQTGYAKEEVEGRMSLLRLVPDEYHDQVRSNHFQRRVKADAVPRQYELQLVMKSGETRDTFITVDMIPGTKQSIASVIDITELHQAERAVMRQKQDLENKARLLEDVNTALKVLLRQREKDREEIEASIVMNIKSLILPHVELLKKTTRDGCQQNSIQILETNVNKIMSPFLKSLTLQHAKLTPRQLQISSLIKDGKATKEIAEILHCSIRSVEFHRNNIRKTLGLNKNKTNLRSYLHSLS